jgi:hypothetical protein
MPIYCQQKGCISKLNKGVILALRHSAAVANAPRPFWTDNKSAINSEIIGA